MRLLLLTHFYVNLYIFFTILFIFILILQGAVPATIAILNGKIKIGLSRQELEELADSKANVIKTSRHDLAYVLSKKLSGGTTVAGTLICANLCGIKLFATGGIGGVHRNGESTLDISADLVELGKSSVTVVSSGIKSILDIPRTMEYLETQGVCVATFQCPDREFPAFYTRASGVQAQYNFDNYSEAAACINKSIQLGLNSSTLIGVPVPNEHAMDGKMLRSASFKLKIYLYYLHNNNNLLPSYFIFCCYCRSHH